MSASVVLKNRILRTFTILLITWHCLGSLSHQCETAKASNMRDIMDTAFWLENVQGRDHLGSEGEVKRWSRNIKHRAVSMFMQHAINAYTWVGGTAARFRNFGNTHIFRWVDQFHKQGLCGLQKLFGHSCGSTLNREIHRKWVDLVLQRIHCGFFYHGDESSVCVTTCVNPLKKKRICFI